MNKKIILFLVAALIVIMGIVYMTKSSNNLPEKTITSPKPNASYTLAEVATHADASSCWAVINNSVYDLITWINQHPGGPDKILGLCGKDGSDAFNGKHGGQQRPTNELAGFFIGTLKK
jgi:cytochrome b involved in lipid metabolism